MIDYVTIENALHAWIQRASTVPAGSVIWENQNGPRPAPTFVSMRIRSVLRVGQDWLSKTFVTTPTPTLTVTARGHRQLVLSITVYASQSIGQSGASALLEQIIQSLHLPSYQSALSLARVGVGSIGQVILVPAFENSAVAIPRATVDVTLTVPAETSETVDFIDTYSIVPSIS